MCEYPDRRIKPIVYTMVASGVRVGAWDYLRWGNIRPIEQDGKIIAAKMIVYAGEDGSYLAYITPSSSRELIDWMMYREESGEAINKDSWVMRDPRRRPRPAIRKTMALNSFLPVKEKL